MQEVEDVSELVLAQERHKEPERVLFVLLQVNQYRAGDEVHTLGVSERLSLSLRFEDA